ncbi:3-oxoacyl-[acyl-carrier protein] reductase [Fontibacillus phaseoli]|uniref:3-oxoacyl-[acyl-carrier protein] reductase n=1 Tax=Fontibacillus phaseoli TaxID=1416533 RepID=A0A369BBB6_9BACL|nr:SDR family oxidoreductase [Fontibacillus phaseoli]RCX17787.1 3-oxoacyl-[acyl-carrier protein] reductase [Fontibacillus phaseoli]
MDPRFTDKVVIVTGASRGIGRAIAEQFANEGARVVVNYSSNREQAEEVVSGIINKGGNAIAVRADISRVDEVKKLFAESLAAYGKLDVLVNNAGIMITKPVVEITEEDFDRMFAINVKGTFFAIQQAALHLQANGRIVNFSTSVAGAMFPAYSVYAGTKGAVEQFTRQLAKELGPKGITINAVAPGPVNTELFMQGKSAAQIEGIASMNAFRRLGETGDITGTVLFLASEEARWITGQTLRINGGFA